MRAAQASAIRSGFRQGASARQSRPAAPGQAQTPNPALNYAQRDYREEDYGDDFFIDLDKYGEGGEGQ